MPAREPSENEMHFLRALLQGLDFNTAAYGLGIGNAGLQVAFACVMEGWVNRNVLTAAGQVLAERVGKANYVIVDEKGNRV